jgi:hypothetical protein
VSAEKGSGPRDWDKELADIDKIIAGTPPAKLTSAGGSPGATAAKSPTPSLPTSTSRGGGLATWLRVGLGVALAAGMTQWPYFHACGTSLFLYLGAIGVLGVSGLWGAISAWRRRMGLAHTVSLLVLLWSGVLAAATILPRVGYARRAAEWWCP